jgi:gluconolactonase
MTAMTRRLVALGVGFALLSTGPAPPSPDRVSIPETVAEGAKLVEVYHGTRVFGGPTWDARTGSLYFTASGKPGQILRLDAPGKAAVWLDHAGAVGTCLSSDGRLMVAESSKRRIMSYGIGPDGPADSQTLLEDPKLAQPSDLCQAPNGDIYFTDPDFLAGKAGAVHRLRPDGRSERLIRDVRAPVGVELAPDGGTIYVSDAALKVWRAYPVGPDGSIGIGKFWFNPITPNRDDPAGMTVDERGNLYLTGRGGVWVATPEGKTLGLIPVKGPCSNVAFGGEQGSTLYITGPRKVYSLAMKVRGQTFTKTP